MLHVRGADSAEISPIRVLMAEDYVRFQNFIRSTLRQRPDLRIICEVRDGLEAVQRAADPKPYLILLDIALPKLNGIAVARQNSRPFPKIENNLRETGVFHDIVQEALSLGTCGYVARNQAQSDLLAAVDAVLEGRQFVRGGLSG